MSARTSKRAGEAQLHDPNGFERSPLPCGGILHLNASPKLKTVLVKIDFPADLDGSVTRRTLIPMVLRRGSRRFPDMLALNRHLEDLYGAALASDVAKVGERHVVKFRLEAVNDRFVPGGSPVFRDAVEFLREVLRDPLLPGGAFDGEHVEGEKRNLRLTIEGLVDDKPHYAMERCISAMCAGEEFRRYELGDTADLPGIDPKRLTADWRDLIDLSPMEVYVSGDIDVPAARGLFEEVFADRRPAVRALRPPPAPTRPGAPRTVEEQMDVQQARLVIGFRHGITYLDGDLEAMVMMNGVLGAFPHSRLFQNVREKASLAYDAHSISERSKGLLFITCGIASENYRKALEICLDQVKALQDGGPTDDEMTATRESFLNHLTMMEDSPGELMEVDSIWRLHGREFDLAGYRERLRAVGRDRVVAAARGLELDTVYFLGR